MQDCKYPNNEKLKSKNEISLLFEKGKWRKQGNLRIIVLKDKSGLSIVSNKVGVSVSKRYFKKAVYRNRIKRLLRESYRLNKGLYKEAFGENSLSMLFWVSQELPQKFQDVEKEFVNLCNSQKK